MAMWRESKKVMPDPKTAIPSLKRGDLFPKRNIAIPATAGMIKR
jgi:hypothetical protein